MASYNKHRIYAGSHIHYKSQFLRYSRRRSLSTTLLLVSSDTHGRGLRPQIDVIALRRWWHKELWLGLFLVVLVLERSSCRLLKGLFDRLAGLGGRFKVWERLTAHNGVGGGHATPVLGLFAGDEAVGGL